MSDNIKPIDGLLERQPGGLFCVSGGTRTEVRLDRPWQAPIQVGTQSCPFETKPQSVVQTSAAGGGWQVVENPFTPFPVSYLVIPSKCWPEKRLRTLGSPEELEAALALVATMLVAGKERWLGVHVGVMAGQNLPHLHYHLIEPVRPPADSFEQQQLDGSEKRIVFHSDGFAAVAAGIRAGQVFLIPSQSCRLDDSGARRRLASVVHQLLRLAADSFRSQQGLAPDFTLAIRLEDHEVQNVTYVPILNHWGFTEYLGLTEHAALVLPWPHEVSAARFQAVQAERLGVRKS